MKQVLLQLARDSGGIIVFQFVIQAVQALIGFFLVHMLTVENYSAYTLVTTMTAILAVLGDSGLAHCVTARMGAAWPDADAVARLLQATSNVRRRLCAFSAILIVPPTLGLLLTTGQSALQSILLVLTGVVGFWSAAPTPLWGTVHRMKGKVLLLQLSEFFGTVLRLVLSLPVLLLEQWGALLATVATMLANGWRAVVVRRQVAGWHYLHQTRQEEPEVEQSLWTGIRGLAAYSWFMVVMAALGPWLAATFGGARQVAEFGALSRLSLLANFVCAPVYLIAAPLFAKKAVTSQHVRYLFAFVLLVIGFFAATIAFAFFWPVTLLQLLGPSYLHLKMELRWALLLQMVISVSNLVWTYALSRGVQRAVWIIIPVVVATVATLLPFIHAGQVTGILILNIAAYTASIVWALWLAISKTLAESHL